MVQRYPFGTSVTVVTFCTYDAIPIVAHARWSFYFASLRFCCGRLVPLRHLARSILIGLYTGTRASAIAAASPYRQVGASFVDLDPGIFYRLAISRRATNKWQTPAPIPRRLLAHMRRWVRSGIVTSHLVEWHGAAQAITAKQGANVSLVEPEKRPARVRKA
jgi:hypothetical protein